MSILSAGSSQGRKGCPLQPGAQLHTVPPPTSPSLSSSPCRHWLLAKTKSPGSSEMALAFLS